MHDSHRSRKHHHKFGAITQIDRSVSLSIFTEPPVDAIFEHRGVIDYRAAFAKSIDRANCRFGDALQLIAQAQAENLAVSHSFDLDVGPRNIHPRV